MTTKYDVVYVWEAGEWVAHECPTSSEVADLVEQCRAEPRPVRRGLLSIGPPETPPDAEELKRCFASCSKCSTPVDFDFGEGYCCDGIAFCDDCGPDDDEMG